MVVVVFEIEVLQLVHVERMPRIVEKVDQLVDLHRHRFLLLLYR